jgi:uncharacterized membrane protein YiaA
MSPNTSPLNRLIFFISAGIYFLASLALIIASLLMIFRSLYDLYVIIAVERVVTKDIIDSISFTIVAIAVFDVGRYILEEEVQRHKELTSLAEVRKTLTRFMVAIAVALSLEGLVGVFDAAVKDATKLIYPVAVVLCAVVVMLGLALYQRISVDVERSADSDDD